MIYGDPIILGGGGSGGPTAQDAILLATVPAGSTATATKNGVTVTPTLWVSAADSSLETALFVFTTAQFDSVNPWTITATDGTNTVSETVLITTNKEYEVTIEYTHWLYHAGDQCTDITGGWTKTTNAGSITFGSDKISIVYASNVATLSTVNAVNTSGFNTLKAKINGISGGGNVRFGIRSGAQVDNENFTAYATSNSPRGENIISLNLSSYQGSYYVGFSRYEVAYEITEVWLE